jgi:16S rRNA (guanine966-N2)-methyltransferase
MRVIAGRLGGRLFNSPNTHRTHPMSDKARGALFNVLGDINGMTVLDPFAGTGALSFEAISRGAAGAVAIESDKAAQKTISENIELLGVGEQVTLVRAVAISWLYRNAQRKFDLVLCDPPFNSPQFRTLDRLARRVNPGGLMVLSWPANEEVPAYPGLKQVEQRSYGDMQLVFYRQMQ